MLSVEPTLDWTLRMLGARAEPGRAVVLEVEVVLVAVVDEAALEVRGTGAFFSGAAAEVEEDDVAGLAAGGRGRGAAVEAAVLLVGVVVLVFV